MYTTQRFNEGFFGGVGLRLAIVIDKAVLKASNVTAIDRMTIFISWRIRPIENVIALSIKPINRFSVIVALEYRLVLKPFWRN
jgi:hypothetical protein